MDNNATMQLRPCIDILRTPNDNYHGWWTNAAGNVTESERAEQSVYLWAQYVTGLIFYPILCILGLSGNSLSIYVLCQKTMRTPTNIYLVSLAISDSIKLINDFLYFLCILMIQINFPTGSNLCASLYPYAHYIFNMSVCCSAWLTVGVAAERYYKVCCLARVNLLCTFNSAILVCAMTFLLTTLLTLPLLFRYKSVNIDCGGDGSVVMVELSELWKNEYFESAYTWIHNLMRTVVPIIIVSTMNVFIIKTLRRTRRRSRSATTRQDSMQRVTCTLVSVIVVFVICVTPDAIISTFGYGYVEENYQIRAAREITDLLLLVNSAVNFVLYIIFNSVFRKNFQALCCMKANDNTTLLMDQTAVHRRSNPAILDQIPLNSIRHQPINDDAMLSDSATVDDTSSDARNTRPITNGGSNIREEAASSRRNRCKNSKASVKWSDSSPSNDAVAVTHLMSAADFNAEEVTCEDDEDCCTEYFV